MVDISQIFGVMKKAVPPEPDPQFVRNPPTKTDPEEMCVSFESVLDDDPLNDLGIIIEYEAASGVVSTRRIRVNKVTSYDGNLYLSAYCYERQAPRRFRFDRILELMDAQTGEIINISPEEYFENYETNAVAMGRKKTKGGVAEYASAYSRCYSGIKALVFIARCDGYFDKLELSAIGKYVQRNCTAGGREYRYDSAVFEKYAEGQYPDYETFERSLINIQKSGSSGMSIFLTSVGEVMNADGVQSSEEFDTYMELDRILKESDWSL